MCPSAGLNNWLLASSVRYMTYARDHRVNAMTSAVAAAAAAAVGNERR